MTIELISKRLMPNINIFQVKNRWEQWDIQPNYFCLFLKSNGSCSPSILPKLYPLCMEPTRSTRTFWHMSRSNNTVFCSNQTSSMRNIWHLSASEKIKSRLSTVDISTCKNVWVFAGVASMQEYLLKEYL